MLRAVVDRILAALAVAFGVYLPADAGTLTAVVLVGMAALDGWLRWRERAEIRALLERVGPGDSEAHQLLRKLGGIASGRGGSPRA